MEKLVLLWTRDWCWNQSGWDDGELIVRELGYARSLYLRNKSEDAYILQAY